MMALFWLRVALVVYAVALVYALAAMARKRADSGRLIVPAILLALVFHFVALVETSAASGHLTPTSAQHTESLLAFFCSAFLLGMWLKYRTISAALFILPPVFVLTLAASVGPQAAEFSSPLLRKSWIFVHVVLIFIGYAALLFSFVASLLYLWQERSLKSKHDAPRLTLPALEQIDEIGYRSLLLGFPFMTLGLIAGGAVAQAQFGASFFLDPKVLLSLLAWAVYMLLLYTRWHAGWRGRRAAILATVAFLAAVSAWAANYFSGVHRFLA